MRKAKRAALAAIVGAGLAAGVAAALAQDVAPGQFPAEDTIAARRGLMQGIDALTYEIEAAIPAELDELGIYSLQQRYLAVAAMLRAFPHLFPPETNLPQPTVADGGNATVATPLVWTDFPTFVALADAAADVALAASTADAAALATTAADLRAPCSACHAQFMEYRAPF